MSGLWDTLANSGVGWFNDILTVQIYFDADLEEAGSLPYTYKRTHTDGSVETIVETYRAVFAAGAHVCGCVRVTAPPGRTIAHNGVSMRLESGFFALEEIATRDLYEESIDLIPAGSVSGTVDFPFVFRGVGRVPLHESYEGDLFSIRHTVTAIVLRPWYTFEVSQSVPFAVQRVYDIPRKAQYSIEGPSPSAAGGDASSASVSASLGAPKSDAAATAVAVAAEGGELSTNLTSQLALYTEQSMAIEDLEEGARITMKYDKGVYEISDHLQGSLVFENIKTPIVLVRLAVVRIEYADGEVHDSVVFDDSILDSRRWRIRKQQARYAERAATADTGAASEAAAEVESEEIAEEGVAAPSAPSRRAARGDDDEEQEDEDENNWMPTVEDLDSDEPDPDLPILGDTSLSVDLDFAQIAVTPTYVIDVDGAVLGEESAKKLAAKKTADAENEVSVRYFLRVTVYTSFSVDARHWNAAEIILHRDHLYGTPVSILRQPPPLPKPTIARSTSQSKTPTAASASPAGGAPSLPGPPDAGGIPKARALSTGSMDSQGATSPHVAALAANSVPQPSTLPFTRSLFGMQRSLSGREVQGALSPKGAIGGPVGSVSPLRAPSAGDLEIDAESGLAGPVDLAAAMTRPVAVNDSADAIGPSSSRSSKSVK